MNESNEDMFEPSNCDAQSLAADAVVARLCLFFLDLESEASSFDITRACHTLLCARQLNVTGHWLEILLSRIVESVIPPDQEGVDVVATFIRQVTLQRFGLELEERSCFLDRWLHRERLRGEDIVTVAWVIGLAAEQLELVRQSHDDYVRQWFIRHPNIESLRVRGWGPRYLELCDHEGVARSRALALLSERRNNGSWGQSPGIDASVAYSLSQAKCVKRGDLTATVNCLVKKLVRGWNGADLAFTLNSLKLFHASGWIKQERIEELKAKACSDRTVFLSHSSSDKPFARRLASDLHERGIRVWLDEAEIRPGDSIIAKIEHGICSSKYLFLVASSSSLRSTWVLEELRMAVHDGIMFNRVRVVPVRLDKTQLPGFLRDKKYVDMSQNYDSGLAELLTLFRLKVELPGQVHSKIEPQ